MWSYNYASGKYLEHAGTKGMRWGYTHGKPNGKRKAMPSVTTQGRLLESNVLYKKYTFTNHDYDSKESEVYNKHFREVLDDKGDEYTLQQINNIAEVLTLYDVGRKKEADRFLDVLMKDDVRAWNYASRESYNKAKEKNLDRYDARTGRKREAQERAQKSQKAIAKSKEAYNQAKEKNLERYDRRNNKRVKSNIEHIMGVASNKARKAIKAGKKFIENLFK